MVTKWVVVVTIRVTMVTGNNSVFSINEYGATPLNQEGNMFYYLESVNLNKEFCSLATIIRYRLFP